MERDQGRAESKASVESATSKPQTRQARNWIGAGLRSLAMQERQPGLGLS